MTTTAAVDRVRGGCVGAAVAVLAVAAHGVGGGDYPTSTSLTLLLALCLGIGALTGHVTGPVPVVGMLAAGQTGGHVALAEATEHAHRDGVLGGWQMVAAHALATVACALLILAVTRLYDLVSQAIRAAVGPPPAAPVRLGRPAARTVVGAFLTSLLGAISRRGPPVVVRF